MINQHSVECDKCDHCVEVVYMSFEAKIKKIKQSGWQIKQLHGIWRHYCPDCKTAKAKIIPKKEIEYWWQKD